MDAQFGEWFEKDGLVSQWWNSARIGAVMWLLSAGLLAHWYFHVPPPGFAIGALAVVAGIMSIRDMKVLGKICWVVVLACFLITEFRAIDRDRAQNAQDLLEQRKEQDTQFQSVLEAQNRDFQATAQNLKDAYSQSQQEFNTTMAGISRGISTYTGGESYAYLSFIPDQQFLAFFQKGDYPLFSVVARIANLDDANHDLFGTVVQVGDLIKGHASAEAIPASFVRSINPNKNFLNLNVFFNARNGNWTELFRARREHNGQWTRAFIVEGEFTSMKKASVMCETIDKGFPEETLDIGFNHMLSSAKSKPPQCYP